MTDPSADWTADRVLAHLRGLGSETNRAGMARYGIRIDSALGIPNATLHPLARRLKRNHHRALQLWKSGVREARLLALFTDEPKKVTRSQAEACASDFDSWEIVDHAADLFCEAGLAQELVPVFADDEREFVRRAGFVMMAWAAVHAKKEPDQTFVDWLVLVQRHASDNRNFVRKAVSWALRQIGKRSSTLHAPAFHVAQALAASSDAAERWIGKDAVKELTSAAVIARLRARSGPS